MPIPDYQTLMLPVLRGFAAGATKVSELLPPIKEQFEISEEEAAELIPSGRVTVLANRTHGARTYLSKAGLLESPKRNVHVITDRGRQVLRDNPQRIDNRTLANFDSFSDWRARAPKPDENSGAQSSAESGEGIVLQTSETPEALIETAFDELASALAVELLEEVQKLSPSRCERLILDLLRAMGYGGGVDGMYRETPRSGDNGFDGIIDEDALGLDAVYIQAKRYAPDNRVGRPALQAFVGSLTGEGAT